ncbi:MAG TPA: DEAD/DEAH box helicase [Acidimicrobiales bacterium]|nr:DEAD/DEAH box helicase [Acidimicrobiales bacterium]
MGDLRAGQVEEELGSSQVGVVAAVLSNPAVDLLFLPGEPPRYGTFAVYIPIAKPGLLAAQRQSGRFGRTMSVARVPEPPDGAYFGGAVQIVAPAPRAVRRLDVPAHDVAMADALAWLTDLDEPWRSRPSIAAWSAAVVAGLGLLARGRLFPAVTPDGWDAWRAGPFDPEDHRLLERVAASLPPAAHCLPAGVGSPLRVMSPQFAVRALWDAMADFLVRTPAAPSVAGGELFASETVSDAGRLAAWLAESGRHPEGSARLGLRVVLDGSARPPGDGTEEPDDDEGADREPTPVAVVQMTSTRDPSLVVDAGDLLAMPASVASRLDPDAETNLLLGLRRGSRLWAPLGRLLSERVPASLAMSDEEVEQLLVDGGEALRSAGIDVLWPSSLLFEGLSLQAVLSAPPDDGAGVFSLAQMVSFDWRVTIAGEALTGEEIEQLAEAKRTIVRLRGKWAHVDPALIARARQRRERMMSALEALAAIMAGQLVVDGETVPVLAEGALASLVERVRAAAEGGTTAFVTPRGFVGELRPYQERGVAWLHQMCELGLGACLADDMGLGKTVQVIGLHLLRQARPDRPPGRPVKGRSEQRAKTAQPPGGESTTLIICPTSLLGNWAREFNRFAPGVTVRRFYGPERTLDGLRSADVVLTTYGVARRDRDMLRERRFSLVVADEAQHAKNPYSDTARAIRSIGGTNRVALTGTPVENRLSELWSILDWTTPGLLGPLERFRQQVAIPVERRRDPEVTERLARTVRPFLLRRKKTDPAIAPDLPARIMTDRVVSLTEEQVTLYEAEVREALEAIRAKKGIQRQGLVFRLMTALKQICNHPAQYLHQAGPVAGRSGKLAALEEILGIVLEEGDSALVFSQYVEMGALIEARLGQLGIRTAFLHGSLSARRRDELVTEFQSGAVPVFLLSLKAGGVGLNLTRASHVIHYDRWWNPAVEDQATDRAHRIGQDRLVQVHRLVAEGTLEDRIAELLDKKRDLAEAVIGGGEAWIAELSDDELADLVKLGAT